MKKPTSYSPEELLELLQTQQVTIVKMAEQIDQLQQRIAQLLHLLYGTKSEKTPKPKDISQTTVSSAFAPTLLPPNKKKPTPTGANGRRPLPKDLPRVRVEHDVSEEQRGCQCCHRKMSRMGKVITEQLEFKPSELYVIEHVRYKYGCQRCKQGIITAELPPQPIEKGLAGPGLITEVIINKYCDHLPLHRQEQRFARLGIDLPRSTLCDWIMQGGSLLKPLVTEMKVDTLLPSKRIFTDDTPTPVQSKGKTHQGRLWVYVGGGNDKPNCVIYEYTSSRSQTAPRNF